MRPLNNDRCLQIGSGRPVPYLTGGRAAQYGSGREALIALIRTLRLGSGDRVLLPAYVPEGIFRPFEVSGCEITLYPLDENLDPLWDELERLFLGRAPRVAVMIHYFGLEKDVTRFGHLSHRHGTLLLEDMAHILPGPKCTAGVTGDYVLYSPSKLIGVPDGGILIARSAHAPLPNVDSGTGFLQSVYLFQQMVTLIISTMARHSPFGGHWFLAFRRLATILPLNGYRTLMSYYTSPRQISDISRWLLRHCDWEGWSRKRRAYAELYAAGLNAEIFRPLRAKFPEDGGPFAYPVLVKSRAELQSYLKRRAIVGTVLEGRWDFIPQQERKQHPATLTVLKEHYLFPTNQCLAPDEVRKIIKSANRWALQQLASAGRTDKNTDAGRPQDKA